MRNNFYDSLFTICLENGKGANSFLQKLTHWRGQKDSNAASHESVPILLTRA